MENEIEQLPEGRPPPDLAPSTRFQKGQSGNPAGRPRGSRNRSTVMAHSLLDGHGEAIMLRAIELAKEGEPVALKMCVDRIVPRGVKPVKLDLPRVEKAADLAEAVQVIIESAAAGEITTVEARDFLFLLECQRKVLETGELAIRIEVLEAEHARRKKEGWTT